MDLIDFLQRKKIEDITLIRGLGIIPAFIRIVVSFNDVKYYLETEINFRVIYGKQMILCFDDMFLNKKYNEMSVKMYRSQVDIEKSLLQINLESTRKKIIGKLIKKLKITPYGDLTFYLSSKCRLQIINDTHLNDSCIFRIRTENECKEIITNNGKKFYIEETLYEICNKNNCIEIKNSI